MLLRQSRGAVVSRYIRITCYPADTRTLRYFLSPTPLVRLHLRHAEARNANCSEPVKAKSVIVLRKFKMIPTTQNEPHIELDDEDDLDDDAPAEKIREPIRPMRYDKRQAELRDAEAKRDALLAQGSLSQNQSLLLRVLEDRVVSATKKFVAETTRGKTDEGRAHERIDEYRKTPAGRDALNAARRKKRAAPNADLSRLTEDEKAKHKRELANARQREFNRRKKELRKHESAADADQRKENQRLRTAKTRAKKRGTAH